MESYLFPHPPQVWEEMMGASLRMGFLHVDSNCSIFVVPFAKGLEISFWNDFTMILHGFCFKEPKNQAKRCKKLDFRMISNF